MHLSSGSIICFLSKLPLLKCWESPISLKNSRMKLVNNECFKPLWMWCQRWNCTTFCPASPNAESSGKALSFPVKNPPTPGPYWEITRMKFASQKLSHLLICAAHPVRPTVHVNVSSGLQAPFISRLCVDAYEASSHGNIVFLKSQQYPAAGDCMDLSFINKQNLTCIWPENRRVMRPALETCRGRSWSWSQSHSWCH